MKRLKSIISSYSLLVVAILFVAYHVISVVTGVGSMVHIFQSPELTVAESHQHQSESTETLTENHNVLQEPKLGFESQPHTWPTRIVMESVDIDLAVEGSYEQQGAWEISETGSNFAINTAIPNAQTGNTAIFGHDRPHLFHRIHDLKPGDRVKVAVGNQWFEYAVIGNQIVKPDNVSVMDQTSEPTLTLITCDGWLSQDRYVVTAKLIN